MYIYEDQLGKELGVCRLSERSVQKYVSTKEATKTTTPILQVYRLG